MDTSWRIAFLLLAVVALSYGYQDNIEVTSYDVTFNFGKLPDKDNNKIKHFDVRVQMGFKTKEYDVDSLKLNAENFKCQNASLLSQGITVAKLKYHIMEGELEIALNKSYIRKKWEYTLDLQCTGEYRTSGVGLFWETINQNDMVIGNFYPTNTRKIFPSFDELGYSPSVTFNVAGAPKDWCLIANGQQATKGPFPFGNVELRHLNLVYITKACASINRKDIGWKPTNEMYIGSPPQQDYWMIKSKQLNSKYIVGKNQGLIRDDVAGDEKVQYEAAGKYSLMRAIIINEWNDLWLEETLSRYWAWTKICMKAPSEFECMAPVIEEALKYTAGINQTSIIPKDLTDITFPQYQDSVAPLKGVLFLRMMDAIVPNENTATINMMKNMVQSGVNGTEGFLNFFALSVNKYINNSTSFLNQWLRSGSIPYVSVNKGDKLRITRKPYGANNEDQTCWDVPLFEDFSTNKLTWINGSCDSDYVIDDISIYTETLFDKSFKGLYRVNYNNKEWKQIGLNLNGKDPVLKYKLLSDAYSFVDAGILDVSVPMTIFADLRKTLSPNDPVIIAILKHLLDYSGRLDGSDLYTPYIQFLTAALSKLYGDSIKKETDVSKAVIDTVCQLEIGDCIEYMDYLSNKPGNTMFVEEAACYGDYYNITNSQMWREHFDKCFNQKTVAADQSPITKGGKKTPTKKVLGIPPTKLDCIKRFTCPKRTNDDAGFKLILNEIFINHEKVKTDSDIAYTVELIAKKPSHIARLCEFFTYQFTKFKGISSSLTARLLKIIAPNIWNEEEKNKIESLLGKTSDDTVTNAVNEAVEIAKNNLEKKEAFKQGIQRFLRPDSEPTDEPTESPTSKTTPNTNVTTVTPTNVTTPGTPTTKKTNSSNQVSLSVLTILLALISSVWVSV